MTFCENCKKKKRIVTIYPSEKCQECGGLLIKTHKKDIQKLYENCHSMSLQEIEDELYKIFRSF